MSQRSNDRRPPPPPSSRNNNNDDYDRQERGRHFEQEGEDDRRQNNAQDEDLQDPRLPLRSFQEADHYPPRMRENPTRNNKRNEDYARNSRLSQDEFSRDLNDGGDYQRGQRRRNEFDAGGDKNAAYDGYSESGNRVWGHCDREERRYNDVKDEKDYNPQKPSRGPEYDSVGYGSSARPRLGNLYIDTNNSSFLPHGNDESLRRGGNESRREESAVRSQPTNPSRERNDYGNYDSRDSTALPPRAPVGYGRGNDVDYGNRRSYKNDEYYDRENYEKNKPKRDTKPGGNDDGQRDYRNSVAEYRDEYLPPRNDRSNNSNTVDYPPPSRPTNDRGQRGTAAYGDEPLRSGDSARELEGRNNSNRGYFKNEGGNDFPQPAPRAERDPPPRREAANPRRDEQCDRSDARDSRQTGYKSPEYNDIRQRKEYGNDEKREYGNAARKVERYDDRPQREVSSNRDNFAPERGGYGNSNNNDIGRNDRRSLDDYPGERGIDASRRTARNEIEDKNTYSNQDRRYSRNQELARTAPPQATGDGYDAAARGDYGPTDHDYRPSKPDIPLPASGRFDRDLPPVGRPVRDGYGETRPIRDGGIAGGGERGGLNQRQENSYDRAPPPSATRGGYPAAGDSRPYNYQKDVSHDYSYRSNSNAPSNNNDQSGYGNTRGGYGALSRGTFSSDRGRGGSSNRGAVEGSRSFNSIPPGRSAGTTFYPPAPTTFASAPTRGHPRPSLTSTTTPRRAAVAAANIDESRKPPPPTTTAAAPSQAPEEDEWN